MGRKGSCALGFLSILFSALGSGGGEGRESRMEREEKLRWPRKQREANVFCLKSKMILHAVQIHNEGSQSRHSPRKTRDNQFIKHVCLGVEEQPASRQGGQGGREQRLGIFGRRETRATSVRQICATGFMKACSVEHFLPPAYSCFVQKDLNFKTLGETDLLSSVTFLAKSRIHRRPFSPFV